MKTRNVASARASANVSGICTICAPMISPTFQPKPPARAVLRDHRRRCRARRCRGSAGTHASPSTAWRRYSMRPLGVSRSPSNGALTAPLRNALTMSLSQSTARLAGIGRIQRRLAIQELLVVRVRLAQVLQQLRCAENADTISGRNSYLICVSSSGAMLRARVAAHRQRALDQQLRVLVDLVAGVALQQVARDTRRSPRSRSRTRMISTRLNFSSSFMRRFLVA